MIMELIQEVIETDAEVVVLGIPSDEIDDGSSVHNCDHMGCGQSHVLKRIAKQNDDGWTYCDDRESPDEFSDWLVTLANQAVFIATYSPYSKTWIVPGISRVVDENPVIAWQPKPEPAKGRDV